MAEDKVLTAPTFQQKTMGSLLVTGAGQSSAQAQRLDQILAGSASAITPVVGIVAHAGGGQALATPLTGAINEVATVATAADSVSLPLAVAGIEVVASNVAGLSMQVFGAGTDTINGALTATGVPQAAGVTAAYYCTKSAPGGTWRRIQSS